jgi:hypothetical protein
MNNNKPKAKSNATALKHVASLLPIVALGMNGIHDRRQLEINIRYADQENLFGMWIRITKAGRAPGKFIVEMGRPLELPTVSSPIEDPVQFLRLFLRNRKPATIILKITLQPAYPEPVFHAIKANMNRGLEYTKLVVYEVPFGANNRRAVFENHRRNTAARTITSRVTSAALNPATALGRKRLMREFNDLTR